jgi:hypothetical protein
VNVIMNFVFSLKARTSFVSLNGCFQGLCCMGLMKTKCED